MTENVKVAISSDFLTAFARLPRSVQGKVTEFVNKFRNDPTSPGIHYEKLANTADNKIYSVRIDDTYRGIVVRQKETGVYLLLWVDHHDEAYQWAARKRCDVNPKTGAIQVYDIQITVKEQTDIAATPIFAAATDEQLLKLGVPEAQLAYIRSFTSYEMFVQAAGTIPADAYEYLSWMLEGFTPEEVIELCEEERSEVSQPEDLAQALDVPATMKSFVVVDGEDELRRMMAEPLEKWRVFLHPTQRRIVKKNYSGPARVLGGAGTGKTVVAMHRAKYLAGKLEGKQRILFTTFTANLAADIKENLRKICTAEELKKIEVIHLDAWINQFLKEEGFSAKIAYDSEIRPLWEQAVVQANVDLPFDVPFYEEEWNRIAIAQEALSLERYAKATRNGRGTRLDRKKRMMVWKVFENYQNLMKEHQIRDINTAMYESAKILQMAGGRQRYAHIIVDEGQDFSDNAFRLLRALAGPERGNDLFIVGDSHQRIYRNYPNLSKCGIQVRGRSSILKINYRTTEEIRKYAFALLNGVAFDDLDEGHELGDKCQSLTHGEKPIVQSFRDARGEFDYIVQEIQRLQNAGAAGPEICIVARTKKLVEDYIAQLTKAGIRSYEIKRNKIDERSFEGVRVATMHRVKGLEFKYVFVVAVNDLIVPLSSAIKRPDPISEAEAITAEKCLLYVAMTRAQKAVYLTSYGKSSPFIGEQ